MVKSSHINEKRHDLPLFCLRLLAIVFFVFLLAGCGKKPVPEPVPSPMTVDYLLAHMVRSPVPGTGEITVQPLPIVNHLVFHDANATLQCLVQAEFPTDAESAASAATYQLLFALTASRWGAFDTAIDTLGNRFEVKPYYSGIRSGVYFEYFYVLVSKNWLDAAAENDLELLLLSDAHEIGMLLPRVYPLALKRYLKELDNNDTTGF